MTNILAIDTSGVACSVALFIGADFASGRMIDSHKIAPKQQANLILPLITELLSAQSLTFNELDAIAYGAGPGSFTGLRLASSVAQAIGFAANIPIIAVSSLAAFAQSVYLLHGWSRVLVALDGRKDQLYWAAYQLGEGGHMALSGASERLISPEEAQIEDGGEWYGAGDAWEIYRDKMGMAPVEISPVQAPLAKAILALALQKLDKKCWISPSDALPVYLNPFKS